MKTLRRLRALLSCIWFGHVTGDVLLFKSSASGRVLLTKRCRACHTIIEEKE